MTEPLVCRSSAVALEGKQLFPGFLLTPFGWAGQPLASIVEANPALLRHVFELNRAKMHAIALGLAHLDNDAVPKIGPVLVRCSAAHILQHVLGRPPLGIKRLLHRLPFAVLTRENYRRLVELLDDPRSGRLVLQHTGADLDDSTIEAIYSVPAGLRPVLLATSGQSTILMNWATAYGWSPPAEQRRASMLSSPTWHVTLNRPSSLRG